MKFLLLLGVFLIGGLSEVAYSCAIKDNSQNAIVTSTPQEEDTTTEACCPFPFSGPGPKVVVEGCKSYVFTCYMLNGKDISVGLFYNMTVLSNGTAIADQNLLIKTDEAKLNFTLSCNTETLLWNLQSYQGITNIQNMNCGYQKSNNTYTAEW